MSRALAVPDDGRRITLCCWAHQPASDCSCCAECVTNAELGRLDPALRAVIAADNREYDAMLRPTYRRVRDVLAHGAWEDDLRSLGRATHAAIAAWCITPEPSPQPRWFTSGVLR